MGSFQFPEIQKELSPELEQKKLPRIVGTLGIPLPSEEIADPCEVALFASKLLLTTKTPESRVDSPPP
jgi:hypothetical protein